MRRPILVLVLLVIASTLALSACGVSERDVTTVGGGDEAVDTGDTGGAVDAIAQISSIINQISDFQNTIATAVEEQAANLVVEPDHAGPAVGRQFIAERRARRGSAVISTC